MQEAGRGGRTKKNEADKCGLYLEGTRVQNQERPLGSNDGLRPAPSPPPKPRAASWSQHARGPPWRDPGCCSSSVNTLSSCLSQAKLATRLGTLEVWLWGGGFLRARTHPPEGPLGTHSTREGGRKLCSSPVLFPPGVPPPTSLPLPVQGAGGPSGDGLTCSCPSGYLFRYSRGRARV